MLAKVISLGLSGIEAFLVEIEVDINQGLPGFNLVGLPDNAVKESRERVKSAIKNSGFDYPADKITISLAPSFVKKEGSGFDLPIALGILAATEQISSQNLKKYVILGELALEGSLRPIKGILPMAVAMPKLRQDLLILPFENAREAGVVNDIEVFPVKNLREAVQFISEPETIKPFKVDIEALFKQISHYDLDFSEVKGQVLAKRALEVAVAGAHNILFIGPPGSGKTMLAKRIPTIMPEMNLKEALEVSKIHSVAGELPLKDGLIAQRPFRQPHHTISYAALVGGGSPPQPGEISLAHQGVLFLDELPEFHRDCLEALRQPLEDGIVRISRAHKFLKFPASFMLVCAMNPCPCGYLTDSRKACRCSTTKIQNYLGKISGPLLDRIDIHIEMPAIKYKELIDTKEAEASISIKARVEKARLIQRNRFKEDKIFCNASMNTKQVKKYCGLDNESRELLKMAMTELGLSARAYDKILRVSRTIADLAGCENILPEHICEAIQYRSLDRQWG